MRARPVPAALGAGRKTNKPNAKSIYLTVTLGGMLNGAMPIPESGGLLSACQDSPEYQLASC